VNLHIVISYYNGSFQVHGVELVVVLTSQLTNDVTRSFLNR